MDDLEKIVYVAQKAVRSSAKIILHAVNKPKSIEYKGKTDLVTITDYESEINIKSIISDYFPNHQITAEESSQKNTDSSYLWIIDPLDGTTNFVHQYSPYSISIGIYKDNIPIVGVVYELPIKNLYTAIRNKGAFCNNKPIRVSKNSILSDSLLVTGFGYDHGKNWEINMELFKYYTDITQGVRRLGAASVDLCHIASGKADGFWEFDLKPWDTAAGRLIVEEAGGIISKINGDEFKINDRQILATNGKIHSTFIKTTLKFLNSRLIK